MIIALCGWYVVIDELCLGHSKKKIGARVPPPPMNCFWARKKNRCTITLPPPLPPWASFKGMARRWKYSGIRPQPLPKRSWSRTPVFALISILLSQDVYPPPPSMTVSFLLTLSSSFPPFLHPVLFFSHCFSLLQFFSLFSSSVTLTFSSLLSLPPPLVIFLILLIKFSIFPQFSQYSLFYLCFSLLWHFLSLLSFAHSSLLIHFYPYTL